VFAACDETATFVSLAKGAINIGLYGSLSEVPAGYPNPFA
jgi:hypothetical protein